MQPPAECVRRCRSEALSSRGTIFIRPMNEVTVGQSSILVNMDEKTTATRAALPLSRDAEREVGRAKEGRVRAAPPPNR